MILQDYDGPLSYGQLIEVLNGLVGETVCVKVPGAGSALTAWYEHVGQLARLDSHQGAEYMVGPHASLVLWPGEVEEVYLRAVEGGQFFTVTLRIGGAGILIGDVAQHASDRVPFE